MSSLAAVAVTAGYLWRGALDDPERISRVLPPQAFAERGPAAGDLPARPGQATRRRSSGSRRMVVLGAARGFDRSPDTGPAALRLRGRRPFADDAELAVRTAPTRPRRSRRPTDAEAGADAGPRTDAEPGADAGPDAGADPGADPRRPAPTPAPTPPPSRPPRRPRHRPRLRRPRRRRRRRRLGPDAEADPGADGLPPTAPVPNTPIVPIPSIPPSTAAPEQRPGWGDGDDNHEHTGPPGQDKDKGNEKEKGKKK